MQMQTVQRKTKQFFDNTFENIEKNVTNQAKQTASSIATQVGMPQSQAQATDAGTQEAGGHVQQQQHLKPQDSQTAEMVEDFYAPSDPNILKQFANQVLPKAGQMTSEEQAQYKKIHKQLHDEVYFRQLLERQTIEQEHAQEEQVEVQEKQMEELKIEEKAKKDDDIALRMVTNKAEQFPGVAG